MRQAERAGTHTGERGDVNRKVAGTFGAIYALTGLAGFFVTDGVPFAGREGDELILFAVNPLHNLVHLAIGAVLILAAMAGEMRARMANMIVGATLLLIGVLGFFIQETELNIIALDMHDNLLHLASGGLLFAVAMWAGRDRTAAATR